jgi:ribosomal protein S18 acetylase RimI-like enzyme
VERIVEQVMARWTVEPEAGHETAVSVLSQDRIANGYALADLEPPFGAYTKVAVAHRDGEAPSAACLILRGPDFTAMVTHGDAEGLDAILSAIDLPERAHVGMATAHVAVVERRFRIITRAERARMAVTRETFRPLPSASATPVRLGPADAPALLDLYADYGESFFVSAQLDGGVFYGIRREGSLVAAGGTHVVAPRAGIAAVGNIYTRPAARGRGYAAAVTAAVTADLLSLPVRDVILNVAVENEPARSIYRRLGYRTHTQYWEANVIRPERHVSTEGARPFPVAGPAI